MRIRTKVLFHCSHLFRCLCLAALLSACAPGAPRPDTPTGSGTTDAAFDALARRYFDEVLALSPADATGLGDHRFDDRLDDVSAAARTRLVTVERDMLGTLRALERDRLSRAHQVDAALLAHRLEYDLFTIEELQSWAWNPLLYTSTAGGSVYSLLARRSRNIRRGSRRNWSPRQRATSGSVHGSMTGNSTSR
jgi:uncharacterized protein (DUF885 family)